MIQIHKIGNIYKLNIPLLNNPKDTLGCCYDLYNIGNHLGFSVIFENGNYDGFSYDEADQFLSYVGYSEFHSNYHFKNVMQLTRHFNNGYWSDIFDKRKAKYYD